MQQLNIIKTIKLLEKYTISFSPSKLATTPQQAAKIAQQIGFPVVLKIISPDILHKSDIGGVKVGLENQEQVIAAYNEILKNVKKKARKAKIDGILVQKIESGLEVIVGMRRDPQFGPVLLFGLGGVFVEILKDTSLRITPVDKNQALEMIKEIKSYPILCGIRGKKPVNISALVNIITKTSNLAEKNKKILELDFNPIIVNEKSATIVDARIMVE